jgi:hypothetical protein
MLVFSSPWLRDDLVANDAIPREQRTKQRHEASHTNRTGFVHKMDVGFRWGDYRGELVRLSRERRGKTIQIKLALSIINPVPQYSDGEGVQSLRIQWMGMTSSQTSHEKGL